MTWLLAAACAVASIPAGLRWLRIAQREHYLALEVTRFSLRWWLSSPLNVLLMLSALAGTIGTLFDVRWGYLVAVAQIGPVGLSLKGVSSPLAWTDRLRRLAGVTGLVVAAAYLGGALARQPLVVVIPLLALPLLVDFSLWVMTPVEKSLGNRWVEKAASKLAMIGADVVAITGSYGKTTTKSYVAHLLAGSRRVVASPASFNNRMGLARAINEGLAPGTEVFVAEMGTYGPGEIAELCRWMPPKVAAIVAVGPVHLERFKTLENIVRSKSEILDGARVGVVCVDHPLLAALARERAPELEIIEVSTADGIEIRGMKVMDAPDGVFAADLAVAVGICVALGLELEDVLARAVDLPVVDHRRAVTRGQNGFAIIDDTFNSNPDGARSALKVLADLGGAGRTAVITPGMVELGHLQEDENRRFATEACAIVDDFVIVGKINRKALLTGSANGKASVTVVDSRTEAVEWARANLGPGDAVLYENDLPDHYP